LAAVAAAQPGIAAARTDGTARRLYDFQSSFQAEKPVESQQTSGGSIFPSMMSPMGSPMTTQQASTQMVSGMVESFLHREPLQAGELDCLSKGTGQLAGQLMSVTSSAMMVMEQVMGGKNGIADGDDESFSAGSGPAPVSQNMGDGASDISAKVDAMFRNQQQGQSSGSTGMASGAASPPASSPAAPSGWGSSYATPNNPAPAPAPANSAQDSASMNLFYGSRRLMDVGPESDGGSGLMGGISPAMAMSAPALMMQFGFNIKSILGLSHKVVKQCVHGDALKALDKASDHMQDLNYVSGHFMANGQDVISELSTALLAWKKGDPKEFGLNFGKAARKVLLSDAGPGGLPEGMPRKEVMANVSAGLIRGMFGEGASADIKIPGDVDHAPETIHVDLHSCVNKNLRFFQSAWAEVMWFFAQRHAKVLKEKEKMQWGTAVAFTMFQAPAALEKCGISREQKDMLMDSIKALGSGGGLDVDMHMPNAGSLNKDKAEIEFANAAKDWSNMKWYNFGHDMGKMLEQAAVTVEKKYYIGSDGGLKKRLIELSEDSNAKAPVAAGSLLALAGLASLAAVPLLGAAGLRAQRAWRTSAYDHSTRLYLETEDDVESCGEESLAVE